MWRGRPLGQSPVISNRFRTAIVYASKATGQNTTVSHGNFTITARFVRPLSHMPSIHLVTYATPRFRLRQKLLGLSARLNQVADTVTSWTPADLHAAGFETRCKDIKLSERGSGFWAWKPFIIDAKLREIPDGDLVFYCDVGRLYPFKLLNQPVAAFVRWMDENQQDMMPGIEIPWDGPNSTWIKREALVTTGMDRQDILAASPVQASFSLWRAGPGSRAFVAHWLDWCSQRSLVSDDPSRNDLTEFPGFRGHRHDQALLTLCCLREQVVGLSLGSEQPEIDVRHPSQVSRYLFGEVASGQTLAGQFLRAAVWPIERFEHALRSRVKFGKTIHE